MSRARSKFQGYDDGGDCGDGGGDGDEFGGDDAGSSVRPW